jgi:hypothetical protein
VVDIRDGCEREKLRMENGELGGRVELQKQANA